MFKWDSYGLETDMVTLILAALVVLLLILVIVLFVKLGGLKSKYNSFMMDSDGGSLEKAFNKKFENMDYINNKLLEVDARLEDIDANLMITFQKVSLVKYDAFHAGGGGLSFVITLLNKKNDGFILNTVHSNSSEGYFSYMKEVRDGRVAVELSEEESRSLGEALIQ